VDRPALVAAFDAFCAGPARDAAGVYVLGDLFDAWIGDDQLREPLAAAVAHALGDLSERGVPVFLQTGNRDFLLGPRFCRDTGGELLTDPSIAQAHGMRVLLTHGDALCTDDAPYQRLRAVVRDARWQREFLGLSVQKRESLAVEARAGSKAHTAGQPAMLMDVNPAAVERAFRDANVDWLVHGHTHRPGVTPCLVDGRPRTRIVTGDWYTQGSVLRWDATGLNLESLPRA